MGKSQTLGVFRNPKPSNLEPWDSPPTLYGFKGGDLLGVAERLDYLQELGITAIYFNPIFQSAANHRYHTHDYYRVDPILGGNEAFRELLDAAHTHGIRVVLDGVFNHASRGFYPFHHTLENGAASPYLDWFYFDKERLRAGKRLDVPHEIEDDAFWQEFRRVVKAANPEAYIVGEIWGDAHRWLQGGQFDAAMNYVFNRACLGFFGGEHLDTTQRPGGFKLRPLSAIQFARAIDSLLALYDWQVTLVQLNLLGSHDTPRFLTLVQGCASKQNVL